MAQTSITDVRTVAVTVTDQDRALSFYVDRLGFEKRLDAPISPTTRWIEVAPPGAGTSIALIGADAAVDQAGVDTGIRFAARDAAAEHSAMRGLGITVSDLIKWDGVPPMFTVDDPDGNRFYVVEEAR